MRRASLALLAAGCLAASAPPERRLLYVASPGIRNYVEWGGKGVLVYDMDRGHSFVERIASPFDDPGGKVENIKGICASAADRRLYLTTLTRVASIDLMTGKPLWVIAPEGGCDRLTITGDGKTLYVPSLEGPHWNVIDAASGALIRKLATGTGAHNTLSSADGRRVYMADLRSTVLLGADPAIHEIVDRVGPFTAPVRPFTLNAAGTRVFANVNGLLGFEVGDLVSGKMLYRVEVPGYVQGPTKRHGCPSHGVGLTPGEKELWVADAFNQRLHVFDATVMPPAYRASIELRVDQPGWITFSRNGDYAYPSTGEVIDTRTRTIVAHLKDEEGRQVQSEKVVEIDFAGSVPVRAGDQFGIGRAASPASLARPAEPPAAVDEKPLRLAIAGLVHGHVEGFLRAATGRGGVAVVGIADPDPALHRKYAQRHGLSEDLFFTDLEAMLDRVKPEAVAAFTSTRDHPRVVEACARRRIPVMMEKPLAVSVADARAVQRAAAAGGIDVIVNYETTWYRSHAALWRFVKEERSAGDIRKMVAMDGHQGPKEIGVPPEFFGWLTDPGQNGAGALYDFGCYGANLMTWLMDGQAPRAVTAMVERIKPHIYPRVDDEATILLEYPKAQGIVQASWNWPFSRKDLDVYGESAYARAVGGSMLRVRRAGQAEEEALTPAELPADERDSLSYLAAVVRGRRKPAGLSSLENNVTVTGILEAARESARTGKVVAIAVSR